MEFQEVVRRRRNHRLWTDLEVREGLVIHRDALLHPIDTVRHRVFVPRGSLEHAQLIIGREDVVKHPGIASAPPSSRYRRTSALLSSADIHASLS
jgi:hypothetical protein